jgi:hypothetical protein
MGKKKLREPFPYIRVARLWREGHTIADIAKRIGRVEKDKDDPYHGLRNFLRIMHRGYRDQRGKIVKLPYRVPKSTVMASMKIGKASASD